MREGIDLKNYSISRMELVLSVYHLFLNCREVSFKEVTDQISGVSDRTVYRTMRYLKDIGVLRFEYSKKANAYIPLSFDIAEQTRDCKDPPDHTEKIRRLCILMKELYSYDHEKIPLHIELYKKLFPHADLKTRCEDFKVLWRLGYEVYSDIDYFSDECREMRYYTLEVPETYGLRTFSEKSW